MPIQFKEPGTIVIIAAPVLRIWSRALNYKYRTGSSVYYYGSGSILRAINYDYCSGSGSSNSVPPLIYAASVREH
jgi:hypothetical protein